ncbi:MAG: hypothetical protein HYZ50_25535 [Deltaproteobacteria bacterium]|nr:hypothetical protein [Deltaproteobacteria bacterium]
MQHSRFSGLRSKLFAAAFALSASLAFFSANTAQAQVFIPGDPDHLKCYEARDENPLQELHLDLHNQFGLEHECRIRTRTALYCTPTSKFVLEDGAAANGDDPRGNALQTPFLCYKVRCPLNPVRGLEVDDQFGHRRIKIRNAQMVCTPTIKVQILPMD